MGYRSDVAVAMKRSFFSKVMDLAPDAVKKLVDCADTFRSSGDSVLLAWSCTEWYTDGNSAPGVFHRAILEVLHSEDGMEEDYLLVELDESEDYNSSQGNYCDNPWGLSIVRSIYIDDTGKDISLKSFR